MFRSDGAHVQTPVPACNTRIGFFSSCGSLERRWWCVRARERERREEMSVEAGVQSPDGFMQTPSKAKDEVNHLGAILLEGM